MQRTLCTSIVATLLAAALPAQRPVPATVFRDFASVQRLRVVCDHHHYGRVQDLIVELPGGRIRDAVVSMWHDGAAKTVVVPFDTMRYEPQSNLLELGACLDGEHAHEAFDASKVQVERRKHDGSVQAAGAVLLRDLVRTQVTLGKNGAGSIQGATLELTKGRVAFVHVAASRKPVGDSELHPAPWAAAHLGVQAKKGGRVALTVGFAPDAAALAKTPDLREVILQDALHRPRVYRAFGVAPPAYDRN